MCRPLNYFRCPTGWPITDAGQAHALLDSPDTVGKVLLTIREA
jgi:hypothetical protein